jgi:hypothetical protein
MRKIQVIFIIMLFCFSFQGMRAQDNSISKEEMGKVFEATNNWFRTTPSFSMGVTHASFENYTTEAPADKTSGYVIKEGSNYHSFLLGIHTIQNKYYKIVIDTAEKIVVVANPDQLTFLSYTQDDYKVFLKNSTATKMIQAGKYTYYKVELPAANPISFYEILKDEKGLLREVKWYYNQQIRKDPNDASSNVKPRMSISFSNYNESPKPNYTETFSESPYFIQKDGKLVVTVAYHTFKLLDQRIRK